VPSQEYVIAYTIQSHTHT